MSDAEVEYLDVEDLVDLAGCSSGTRTWLIIDVELVTGGEHGDFWPRPGRTFVAARTHTFEQFAEAIEGEVEQLIDTKNNRVLRRRGT